MRGCYIVASASCVLNSESSSSSGVPISIMGTIATLLLMTATLPIKVHQKSDGASSSFLAGEGMCELVRREQTRQTGKMGGA